MAITTIIVSGVIGAFAKFIIEKIFGPYIPERKKLSSYIKNFLYISLAYALPIASIIYLMAEVKIVDKVFVLGMALNFFALSTNISGFIMVTFLKSNIKVSQFMAGQYEATLGHSEIIRELYELTKEQKKRIVLIEEQLKTLKKSS